MGKIRHAGSVKLITGLISADVSIFDKLKNVLEKKFRNSVDFESPVLDFTHTDYYAAEMGPDLKRKFFSFKNTVSLKNIEKVKIVSNEVEELGSSNGKRVVNIDPGYLDLSKLVLFSSKDFTHRIHVGNGIFAEVTLRYMDKDFRPWPWTYPDYKSEEYLKVFRAIREIYKNSRTIEHADQT